jgi:VanZ family protein
MQLLMSPTPQAKHVAFWIGLAAVTVLSLMPTDFLPPPVFSLWDKAQHALGFAVLTALGLLAYPQRPWRMALALLIFGGAIEVAQAATGWRHGDWFDLFADAVGIVLGGGFFRLMGRPTLK